MKIRIDPIFSLILGIVLGFWLSTFLLPTTASAFEQTDYSTISGTNGTRKTVYQTLPSASGVVNSFTVAVDPRGATTTDLRADFFEYNDFSTQVNTPNDFSNAYSVGFATSTVGTPAGGGPLPIISGSGDLFFYTFFLQTPVTLDDDKYYSLSINYNGDNSTTSQYFYPRGSITNTINGRCIYRETFDTSATGTCQTIQDMYVVMNGVTLLDSNLDIPSFTGISRNTRFLSANVTASTTNPRDVHFDISYFLDANEIDRQISALNPTLVSISWAVSPSTAFSTRGFNISTTTGTSSARFTVPAADFPNDGVIDAVARFSNSGCVLGIADCPFPDSYLYMRFKIVNQVITSSTTVENYNTVNVPVANEVCSISNFSGCINNSLIYLFVPSQDALNGFLDIRTQLDDVKPFGYFTRILTAVGGVNASSTSAYTMPQIPFQEAIFDPLRDAMGVILWGVFAFVFYNKRLKNIDI